ncbi:hypothetical protein [Hydrogenophaga sp.]|uniref:hypothetical protein n=1 Tax=Hydrogenophaga sp. TaxID=1904254 RepID=UPI00272F11E7|nr:hypothetical protein [Hydrogenophaga sp.]MDP2015370.1 hypothetical protein [Hydrogenophaga sp.]MDP3168560.1 hypothetical protein [Hydrogenophaga sp.]
MTPVLLDTNAYLRLAKRIRPLLGKPFGQKAYVLAVLRDVDDEVHRSPRLRQTFPWFDAVELAVERKTYSPRLSQDEKDALAAAASVLHGLVQMDPTQFMRHRRSPPSYTDCRVLAFGQIRPAVVVTDDLGMHALAELAGIENVWHGHDLLKKMLSAKLIDNELVRDIYTALEVNNDLPASWVQAKHVAFLKIFGKAP